MQMFLDRKNVMLLIAFIAFNVNYSQDVLMQLDEELTACMQNHPVPTANFRIQCYNEILLKLEKSKDSIFSTLSTDLNEEQENELFEILEQRRRYNDSVLNATYVELKEYETGAILRANVLSKKLALTKKEFLFLSNYEVE